MIPTFFDINTGKSAKSPFDENEHWWTEGNGSCDCNRHQGFGPAVSEEIRAQFEGACAGTSRFVATDIEGDLEGYTKEHLLLMMNAEYRT